MASHSLFPLSKHAALHTNPIQGIARHFISLLSSNTHTHTHAPFPIMYKTRTNFKKMPSPVHSAINTFLLYSICHSILSLFPFLKYDDVVSYSSISYVDISRWFRVCWLHHCTSPTLPICVIRFPLFFSAVILFLVKYKLCKMHCIKS